MASLLIPHVLEGVGSLELDFEVKGHQAVEKCQSLGIFSVPFLLGWLRSAVRLWVARINVPIRALTKEMMVCLNAPGLVVV